MLIGANPHGGDIYNNKVKYDFSANVSPLGTPLKVQSALQNTNVLAYPDPYCTALRAALANEHKTKAENIFCGNGAAEIIFTYALALKPKTALVVTPTFCEYEKALATVGTKVEHYELSVEDNFALTDDFLNSITINTDTVFLCNPNNPTGICYDDKIIAKIIRRCEQTKTILFLDECFYDFTGFNNSAVNNLSEWVCVLKAFTKMYGMAGVRLGYLMTENYALMQKMSDCVQTWNVSTLAQNAGLSALDCQEHKKTTQELVKKERDYLQSELEKLNIKYIPSSVNFILLQCEINLHKELLKQQILIRPCANFKGLNTNYYRIAVKSHKENTALITAIKAVLNQHENK